MFKRLSVRLFVLTALCVVLVDAVIVVSSVSRFHLDWLGDRLWGAQIASLTAEGSADPHLAREALEGARVESVTYQRGDGRVLRLGPPEGVPAPVAAHYDLRVSSRLDSLLRGIDTVTGSKGLIEVTAAAGGDGTVTIVVDDAPLRAGLLAHMRDLVLMSLLVSAIVAGLVYVSLLRVLVRPLQGLAAHLAEFSAAPGDARRVLPETGRRDEIGMLQRSLRDMEEHVRHALAQKHGLAMLGEAVAKVNHDLRNILATARLVTNRLSQSEDPAVRTISVTLMQSIDRAIELCSDTLKFGRPQELRPRVIRFPLRPLVEEVGRSVGLSEESNPMFVNHVSPHMEIDGDPEHLFRALQNLMRNSVEAIGDGFGEVAIRCYGMGTQSVIEISDTGPGMPEHARENLFKAFVGTTHAHGAGLGLVNVQEIAQAHGGEVRLAKSDSSGTVFRLHLPLQSEPRLHQAAS